MVANKKFRVALATLLLSGIVAFVPSGALAAELSPSSGPTAGGTVVTIPAGSFTSISGGLNHSVGIGVNGKAYAWGSNVDGQLGDGTQMSSRFPIRVASPEGVTYSNIVAGGSSTLALSTDGDAYTWGSNVDGVLGIGDAAPTVLAPTRVLTPVGVKLTSIVAGKFHSLALGSDGNVYSWGRNLYGELGNGSTNPTNVPVTVQLPTGVTFTSLAAGENHSLGLGSDGNVYAWGFSGNGEAVDGLGVGNSVPVKVQVPAGLKFTSIAAGGDHSLALGADGNVYAWGLSRDGEVVGRLAADSAVPVKVVAPAGVTFTSIAAGGDHSLALGSDKKLYAWGLNGSGQLGDGSVAERAVMVRVQAPAGARFTSIAAGGIHSLALGSDGFTYGWGSNEFGQVGNESSNDETVAALVDFRWDATRVAFDSIYLNDLAPNGKTWTVTSPAHGCGPVDVAVEYARADGHGGPDGGELGEVESAFVMNPGAFVYGSVPEITKHPESAKVLKGATYTASVGVSGDETPTLQWQSASKSTGPWTDISGATSSDLSAVINEETHFRVVATNPCGVAVSTAVAAISTTKIPPTTTPPTTTPPTTPPTTTPKPESPDGDLAKTGNGLGVADALRAGFLLVVGGVLLAAAARRASHNARSRR